MQKSLTLVGCLLFISLRAAAQTTTEVSYWQPKNHFSSNLSQTSTTITLWKGSLPAEVRDYTGKHLDQLTLYNSDGRPVELQRFHNIPNLCKRTLYTYNTTGQSITETDLSAGNDTLQLRHYRYDAAGRPDSVYYSFINKMDKKVDVTESYSYDEQGRLLQKVGTSSYYKYPRLWVYEYSLDENNHKKVKELYSDTRRKPRLSKASTYDDKGLLIREFETLRGTHENIVRTFSYTFDEKGDWVTKKVYEQRSIYENRFVGEYRQTRTD